MYSTPIAPAPQIPAGAIPPLEITAYQRAAQVLASRAPRCRLVWPVLAAIGKVESDHAGGGELQSDGTAVVPILGPELSGSGGSAAVRDTDHGVLGGDVFWDRAVGPMQILPSVWRRWGATDRAGAAPDPQNIFDATLTAGELLCGAGGDLSTASGLQRAVHAYNHAPGYVPAVLAWAAFYAAQALTDPTAGSPGPSFFPSPPSLPTGEAAPGAASPVSEVPTTALAAPSVTVAPARGAARATPPMRRPGNPPSVVTGPTGPPHSPSPRRSSSPSACPCRPYSPVPPTSG